MFLLCYSTLALPKRMLRELRPMTLLHFALLPFTHDMLCVNEAIIPSRIYGIKLSLEMIYWVFVCPAWKHSFLNRCNLFTWLSYMTCFVKTRQSSFTHLKEQLQRYEHDMLCYIKAIILLAFQLQIISLNKLQ